jgi:hypothetical protein
LAFLRETIAAPSFLQSQEGSRKDAKDRKVRQAEFARQP